MVSPSIPHSSRSFLVTTLRPHRWRIAGLFLILLAGIAISVITPIIASAFIDGVIGTATYRYLLALALGTIALALISQGIALVETWMAESLSWDTTNAVRLRLISHVLGLDISVHTSQAVGALIDRVDGDVSMMARFLSRYIVVVVGNAHLILAILAVMITRNTAIGLILTATVLITLLLAASDGEQHHSGRKSVRPAPTGMASSANTWTDWKISRRQEQHRGCCARTHWPHAPGMPSP
ncbi:MAG: ABC transporter transmembrane domain-containing protein [Thermomicrobiales bacterium]|nr:ABC transporter transmembrane domain-containing protein [Thermomicrobiales bacterium]